MNVSMKLAPLAQLIIDKVIAHNISNNKIKYTKAYVISLALDDVTLRYKSIDWKYIIAQADTLLNSELLTQNKFEVYSRNYNISITTSNNLEVVHKHLNTIISGRIYPAYVVKLALIAYYLKSMCNDSALCSAQSAE